MYLCIAKSLMTLTKSYMRDLKQLFRNEKGTAAVEFALLSPLYILLLMGLIAYSVYLGAAHSVQQIAADAARMAVGGMSEEERERIVTEFIADHSGRYAFVDPAKITVAFATDTAQTNYFVVIITYDADDLPIWQLATNLPLPNRAIVRQSVVRIGGV